nr:hypothetical protein [Pseudonocardia sp. HH130629-09]
MVSTPRPPAPPFSAMSSEALPRIAVGRCASSERTISSYSPAPAPKATGAPGSAPMAGLAPTASSTLALRFAAT